MSLTIDLPASLEAELAAEAQREGITVSEQATFLVYLANAILKQEAGTPFRIAVRAVLELHRIDPDRFTPGFKHFKQLGDFESLDSFATGDDETSINEVVAFEANRTSTFEPASILGKYAYLGGGTEEFMREKRDELDREDRY